MNQLQQQYLTVRQRFEALCAPLRVEDYGLQAVPETSPAKWHLAHTSWFFEIFLLKEYLSDYTPWNGQFEVLFNSYYNGIGEQFPRAKRHLLSRPTVNEVYQYRQAIDECMIELLNQSDHSQYEEIVSRTVLGIHHEQQHQELFFTDLKYNLYQNPLYPAYQESGIDSSETTIDFEWLDMESGLYDIGFAQSHSEDTSFSFDNEHPRHKTYLEPYRIANRLVTNTEFAAFIADGGYRDSALWLSDGWATVQEQQWSAPLYWMKRDSEWYHYTLHGLQPITMEQPVCHISAYEADAFARWSGARLPSEAEWEVAAMSQSVSEQESLRLEPMSQNSEQSSWFNQVWQWTSSAYQPYPGFRTADGAIGEYNGKFMCNQQVLRGGSVVTPPGHFRPTYRNFFYPPDRWQYTGIRLAQDNNK